MTRISIKKLFLPTFIRILLAVLISAGITAALLTAEPGLPLRLRLSIILILLFILVYGIHRHTMASRLHWAESVGRALERIAMGNGSWRKEFESDAAIDAFGPDIRSSLDRLAENTRVLRRERRQSRMVIDSMADGIIAINKKGRITICNPAARRMCCAGEPLEVGMRLEDTQVHPEVTRLAHECLEGRCVLKSEIKLSGWPQKVINIYAAWYSEASSGADSVLIILHDLTDVRRHEMNQKEFVANVSHEFKTPLTAVRTSAEALLAGAKNDEDFVDRFLNSIIAESDRLSVLIEDLLDIARRDAGITRTERSHCTMIDIVNRAVRAVLPQADRKSIRIDVDVSEDLIGYCDEAQTVQMVRNLIDNAVKYTSEGGRVDVSVSQDGSDITIKVMDNGIGIPHGELDKIFERFYRVDKARSRRLGGTGLGLAIVKDIVESHGGKISVETQLGKGSTFIVTLPAREQGAS
jgi:two-component system phosphate regulon sensor histidine kinase PhoR